MKVRGQLSFYDVRQLLAEAPFKWYIAGGWAIEEFVGAKKIRKHDDVDIVVFYEDKEKVFNHLKNYELQVVVAPSKLLPQSTSGDLTGNRHTVWVKDRVNDELLFELLFNEIIDKYWVYRRDSRITLPLSDLSQSSQKTHLLAPEVVLLYKSKNIREVDVIDFTAALPLLSVKSKAWLKAALQITAPKHNWISRL